MPAFCCEAPDSLSRQHWGFSLTDMREMTHGSRLYACHGLLAHLINTFETAHRFFSPFVSRFNACIVVKLYSYFF